MFTYVISVMPVCGAMPRPTYDAHDNLHETSHGRGRGFESLIAHPLSEIQRLAWSGPRSRVRSLGHVRLLIRTLVAEARDAFPIGTSGVMASAVFAARYETRVLRGSAPLRGVRISIRRYGIDSVVSPMKRPARIGSVDVAPHRARRSCGGGDYYLAARSMEVIGGDEPACQRPVISKPCRS
jgi:hypothetical protein